MSLIGAKGEATEHMVMPGELTAEIQAIRAKVGVAANPSRPATSATGLGNESSVPVAANLVTSDPPSNTVSNDCDTKTLSQVERRAGVTSVTGFQWTR